MTKLASNPGNAGLAALDSSTEKEIFHAAHALADATARREYLDETVGRRPALK